MAAVWAEENTRDSLFDAMKRRETYATTGSRMVVRFFGGWNFTEADTHTRLPAAAGYAKGVPMGGDISAAPNGKAPTFLIRAVKDPVDANLDRVQVVKGWLDDEGMPQEKVFNVVWSDGRDVDADGNIPPVGNTVDLSNGSYTNCRY